MPIYPKGEPKIDAGDNFTAQVEQLAFYAKRAADSALNGAWSLWYRPANFNNTALTDIANLGKPFDRAEYTEKFEKVTKEANAVGTVGDLFIIQNEGEFLATLERAFRARHHTSVRSRIHALARLAGHGHDLGPIKGGWLHYVHNLDTRNKSEKVGG